MSVRNVADGTDVAPMTVVVRPLSKQQAEAFRGQLVTIYRDAFRAPPYDKEEGLILLMGGPS